MSPEIIGACITALVLVVGFAAYYLGYSAGKIEGIDYGFMRADAIINQVKDDYNDAGAAMTQASSAAWPATVGATQAVRPAVWVTRSPAPPPGR